MNNYQPCRHRPLKIKFDQPFTTERLAFVESVLSVMNESRFGPGHDYQFLATSDTVPGSNAPVFDYRTQSGVLPALERMNRIERAAEMSLNSPASQTTAPLSGKWSAGASPSGGFAAVSLSNGEPPGHGPPALRSSHIFAVWH